MVGVLVIGPPDRGRGWRLGGLAEGGESLLPNAVQVGAQGGHAVGVEPVDAAGAFGQLTTRPPSLSTRRCWDTADRVMGSCWASSPTVLGVEQLEDIAGLGRRAVPDRPLR